MTIIRLVLRALLLIPLTACSLFLVTTISSFLAFSALCIWAIEHDPERAHRFWSMAREMWREYPWRLTA